MKKIRLFLILNLIYFACSLQAQKKGEKFILEYETEVYDSCIYAKSYYRKDCVGRFLYCIDKEGNYNRLFDSKESKYLLDEYQATSGNIKQKSLPFIKIKHKGKWGVINYDNQEVLLEFKYDSIGYNLPWKGYDGDCVGFVVKDGKHGLIDGNFNYILPPKYDSLYIHRDEERVKVKLNGKYGIIDRKLETVIPIDFDSISFPTIYTDNFIVKKGNSLGVYDKNGVIKIPIEYDSLSYPIRDKRLNLDKYIVARKNGKYGVINFLNETLINFNYDYLEYYSSNQETIKEYIFIYSIGNKFGLLNFDNHIAEEISDSPPLLCPSSSSPFYSITIRGKIGVIDNTGAYVINPAFDQLEEFSYYGSTKQKNELFRNKVEYSNKEISRINYEAENYSDYFLLLTKNNKVDTFNMLNYFNSDLQFIPVTKNN